MIYYINLDHREDRKQQFLDQMNKVGINQNKIIRIPAIYKKSQGNVGCSMSHVKAMETFIKSNYENCIIFEDDFEFVHDADFVKTFKDENFGVALWKYFLMAALLFLAIEILLVRLMK